MRYSPVERTCYALAWVARRLRTYMLSHTTWLISKMDLIKYIFEKPALTGKIARWQVALSEYDIVHVMQKAIKGNIFSLTDEIEQGKRWTLLFDGASNALGYGIEAVLISPQRRYFPFTARLGFSCTSNMAEYEACTMGIAMAMEYQVKNLKVYGDSVLVIHQLRDEWKPKMRN
ncbi:hypothetical protein CR513_18973, partial [Mucuna pruriens]